MAARLMRGVRVYRAGGPQVLTLEEDIPVPECAHHQVLVRVHAAGVNPVDTYIREGAYNKIPDYPFVTGKDAAGVVDSVGSKVTSFKAGDRVFCCCLNSGACAEYVACAESEVFPLHERLSFSEGAALGVPYFTAYRALVLKGKPQTGEKLLVHGGSGGVGLAAIQLGRKLGLTVVATAGTEDGLELVKKTGAHHAFNHKEKGYLINAVAAIGGSGFDIVLENLANVNLGHDLTILNHGARVLVVGSRGPVEINPRHLMLTEGSIHGVALLVSTPEEMKTTSEAVLRGVEEGWLTPVISREYSLDQVQDAQHDIIHNRGARGKLVVKI